MKAEELTIEALAERAGPWPFWEGQCYGIALIAAEMIDGAEAVYGHWLGEVHPEGYWGKYANKPFLRHGWVKLADGRVLDPTRWSFEAKRAYLWIGENGGEYDQGGQHIRKALRAPPPGDDASEETREFKHILGSHCLDRLNGLLGREPSTIFNKHQIFWLANAPMDDLGQHARAWFEALEAFDLIEFVPVDHRQMAGMR
jgi:hypothetical protein